eukprot:scaffold17151_cov160-Amphora_coffeaeformis.AAC.7
MYHPTPEKREEEGERHIQKPSLSLSLPLGFASKNKFFHHHHHTTPHHTHTQTTPDDDDDDDDDGVAAMRDHPRSTKHPIPKHR